MSFLVWLTLLSCEPVLPSIQTPRCPTPSLVLGEPALVHGSCSTHLELSTPRGLLFSASTNVLVDSSAASVERNRVGINLQAGTHQLTFGAADEAQFITAIDACDAAPATVELGQLSDVQFGRGDCIEEDTLIQRRLFVLDEPTSVVMAPVAAQVRIDGAEHDYWLPLLLDAGEHEIELRLPSNNDVTEVRLSIDSADSCVLRRINRGDVLEARSTCVDAEGAYTPWELMSDGRLIVDAAEGTSVVRSREDRQLRSAVVRGAEPYRIALLFDGHKKECSVSGPLRFGDAAIEGASCQSWYRVDGRASFVLGPEDLGVVTYLPGGSVETDPDRPIEEQCAPVSDTTCVFEGPGIFLATVVDSDGSVTFEVESTSR